MGQAEKASIVNNIFDLINKKVKIVSTSYLVFQYKKRKIIWSSLLTCPRICKDDGMAQAEDLRVSNLFKTLRFHQSNKNYSSTRAQSRRKEKIKTFPAFFQRRTEWKNER